MGRRSHCPISRLSTNPESFTVPLIFHSDVPVFSGNPNTSRTQHSDLRNVLGELRFRIESGKSSAFYVWETSDEMTVLDGSVTRLLFWIERTYHKIGSLGLGCPVSGFELLLYHHILALALVMTAAIEGPIHSSSEKSE